MTLMHGDSLSSKYLRGHVGMDVVGAAAPTVFLKVCFATTKFLLNILISRLKDSYPKILGFWISAPTTLIF